MIATIMTFMKNIHKIFKKKNIYKVLIFIVLFMVISTFGFFIFESKMQKMTIFDAFWWAFVTITTVGYGDLTPITFVGRIIASLMMVIGIGSFGFITAGVASVFVDKMLRERKGMVNHKIKNHIVIFGWNKKTRTIIKELKGEGLENEIMVISNIEEIDMEDDIYFVHGEETDDTVLERANVKDSYLAIVLSDERINEDQMIDAKSVLICMALDKINTNIHIVAEVKEEKNIPHFERANVNDYIVSSQINSKIITRGALYKNVSNAIKELMTNEYENEMYERDV